MSSAYIPYKEMIYYVNMVLVNGAGDSIIDLKIVFDVV